MISLREISFILLMSIIFAFTLSLMESITSFLYMLLIMFVVIMLNVFAKKVTSHYLDSEIEVRLWEVGRFGFKPKKHLKKPFPLGVVMPIVVALVSLGFLQWMASLVFEVKAKVHRAAKRWGLYSFSEMTESHIGVIAASGVIVNLFFALFGYLLGLPDFARLNVYFAFFNMLPISDLDGNKIFFGNIVLWSFLAIVSLIALGYAILLI